MQNAKDSFYMALRERLLALNPSRTVVVDGQLRPAVVVCENERTRWLELPDAFYLQWRGTPALPLRSRRLGLATVECEVGFRTEGSETAGGTDRGRSLTQLQQDLISICEPRWTAKRSYASEPPIEVGSRVFWSAPKFSEITSGDGLRQTATVAVYFYGEEEAE